jgi:hypothetical protein
LGVWLAIAGAAIVGVGACGDETGGTTTDQGTGASTGSGTGSGTGGMTSGTSTGGMTSGTGTGGTTSGTTSTSTGAGGDALMQCLEQAKASMDPLCGECACNKCLNELVACEMDAKCKALRECSVKNMCCDPACVTTKCPNELNAAGGLGGESTGKAIALRNCVTEMNCPCCK